MNRQMTCGTSSISFQNPVFVQSCASVVSQKEGEGPLGAYFDTICEDPMFGTDTWEAAESTLQKQAALLAIKKKRPHMFRYTASFCRRPAGSDISLFFRNR